ncbi:MAG: hypothetical protein WC631_02820 [Candidatus Paceibacterota bacterium]|jgi:hypothetical protein
MFDIAKYLEKFKILSFSRDFLRNSVVEAVNDVCKIKIDPKNVVVKAGIARINERPIIKSEIFLKKTKILEILNKKAEGKVREVL